MNTSTFTPGLSNTYLAASEQTARQREVDNALLVQALCERRPSPGVVARMKRYVSGELSREQAFAELYTGTY